MSEAPGAPIVAVVGNYVVDMIVRPVAESPVSDHGACTMCGEFCAYKVMDDAMAEAARR